MIGREQAVLSTQPCLEKLHGIHGQEHHLLNMKFLDQDIIDTFPQTVGTEVFLETKSQQGCRSAKRERDK